MNFKSTLTRFIFLLLLLVLSCGPDNNSKESKIYSINGYAQKGPFVVGSAVTISELDSKLIPTGNVFFSTILTDEGYFELPGVTLNSPFVQIKVEGKFFGEATGGVENDPLILYSIADIRDGQSINVNITTHLIKRRVEKLVQEKNESFADAKDQAFRELLKTFNWSDLNVGHANQLNITNDNVGGSVLLTISIIFDNIRDAVARLKVITDFQTDLGDGSLDDKSTQSVLVSSAASVIPGAIKSSLESHFGSVNFPDFTEPLKQFVENTEFVNFLDLFYPTSFNGKENLIRRADSTLTTSETYYASITTPPGLQNSFLFYIIARTDSENNRFNTPAEFWDQSYAQGGVQCLDSLGKYTCFESYAMLSTDSLSQGTNVQIPITFSGTGTMTLFYSAQVNGTYNYIERKFTW